VIEVSNLSKRFKIWEDRSRDLKETAINFLKGKRRSFRDVWALRDVNFKIEEGESVGFIGENGSGKSTLLKLLCGIFVPDEGKIVTHGKISALLELGVGFHPDLTGEENIFLNGSMLGFNQKEMKQKFEEIVNFSEIGDFIYSPIRTYSSGMAMRLAFSIAMCVDPDILLIDEVLAVGDEAFQKKCLKRLEEFKMAKKTIVIVSHALKLVREFCERAILLYEGQLIIDGSPEVVIDKYHAMLSTKERTSDLERVVEPEKVYFPMMNGKSVLEQKEEKKVEKEKEKIEEFFPQEPKYERYGTFEAEIVEVALRNEKEEVTNTFTYGERMSICLKIRFHRAMEGPLVGFYIREWKENRLIDIYGTNTRWQNIELGSFKRGEEVEVRFLQRLPIPEGMYYTLVAISDAEVTNFCDWQENGTPFMVKKEDSVWTGMIDLNSQVLINRCCYTQRR
jgi:ABC-type polysaccharide/polyol phosphate transport system ATPase subunit